MGFKIKKPSGAEIKRRFTSARAWELPKQGGALAPEYVWVRHRDLQQHG